MTTFDDESVIPEVYLHTRRIKSLRITCQMLDPESANPYPAVDIGWHCTWYPSMEQLARLRDVITEFLESQAVKP